MILLDYSNILHRAAHLKIEHNLENLRKVILNQILSFKKKFSKTYGKLIICLDGRKNWRYEKFKHYKYKRRKDRRESHIDWKQIHEYSNIVLNELREHFPYQVIYTDIAEADDIIAHLALETDEPTVILSSDSDMQQLTANPFVKHYSLYHNEMLNNPDPMKDLIKGIIKGQDGKDGIPNILSPIDSFVIGQRQKPVTQKLLDKAMVYDATVFCESNEMYERYKLNQLLIDMRYIPQYVHDAIKIELDKPIVKRPKLYKYFMAKGLDTFMKDIPHFNE